MMGFNTWNHFGCRVNATILTTTADLMVSTGLARAGYEYVNSDDCECLLLPPLRSPRAHARLEPIQPSRHANCAAGWMVACRNPALIKEPARSKCDGYRGPQIPDPIKFPQGIEPVIDHIHAKGLKVHTVRIPQLAHLLLPLCHRNSRG
eukprot:SAG11_NODE_7829_length_1091_cov_1.324597_2_plen_149_part_00